jgi:hypothetical protein
MRKGRRAGRERRAWRGIRNLKADASRRRHGEFIRPPAGSQGIRPHLGAAKRTGRSPTPAPTRDGTAERADDVDNSDDVFLDQDHPTIQLDRNFARRRVSGRKNSGRLGLSRETGHAFHGGPDGRDPAPQNPGRGDGPSDPEWRDRYARGRDQAAFATLVWRYGPLVLAVAEGKWPTSTGPRTCSRLPSLPWPGPPRGSGAGRSWPTGSTRSPSGWPARPALTAASVFGRGSGLDARPPGHAPIRPSRYQRAILDPANRRPQSSPLPDRP